MLSNPDKFVFCQWFLPTEGGGCLPHKSGVPNACLEYMRRSYFSEKSWKFYKIVEMLFELLIDWVVENR